MKQWPFEYMAGQRERLGLKGWINFKHFDQQGNLIGEYETPNTIVVDGLAQAAGLINGVVTEAFDHIAIGTGTTAASSSDTALVAEAERASATCSRTTTTETNDTAQLVNTFSFNAGSAITESGVQDAASVGTILCRQTFSAINVSSGDSLQVTWKVAVS